jgi:hypothetical protein
VAPLHMTALLASVSSLHFNGQARTWSAGIANSTQDKHIQENLLDARAIVCVSSMLDNGDNRTRQWRQHPKTKVSCYKRLTEQTNETMHLSPTTFVPWSGKEAFVSFPNIQLQNCLLVSEICFLGLLYLTCPLHLQELKGT